MIPGLLALLFLASASAQAPDVPADETPIHCDDCDDWNRSQAPFRIYGDTYYVGVHGLSSVLIVTKDGMILLDGDLPQSAERIVDNIKTLGFDAHDVRWIVSSHVHFDLAGGIAALQRITGANVAASAPAAEALRVGIVSPDDPQYDSGKATRFPPVQHADGILDGETVELGGSTLTAHYTPGHTPGGTTWTWRSCDKPKLHCVDMVYADSLSPTSSGNFRFGDTTRNPTTADVLRRSIDVVRGLNCDVLISVQPDMSDVLDKAAANARDPSKNAFIDRSACRAYADHFEAMLDAKLKDEATGTAKDAAKDASH